MDIANVGSV